MLDGGDYLLRALQPGDALAWYTYLSNAAVTQFTSYNIHSVDEVVRMVDWYIWSYEQRQSLRWAIALKETNALIGTCGFYQWDVPHALAELGYDLTQEFWGKGIMSWAVNEVVTWGFEHLEINRIQATVMVGNTASERILQKCGFQKEGRLREYKVCHGSPCDFWIFSLLRRDVVKM